MTSAPPPGESRAEREARAHAYLAPYLAPYAPLLASYDDRFFRLVRRCTRELDDLTTNRVRSLLASRVANDLHAVWMLASHGYAIQAATAAATLIENGFRLTYIASSPEMAAAWIAEEPLDPEARPSDTPPTDDPPRPPGRTRKPKPPWASVVQCVREVHARYPTDATWEQSYQLYREMCRAKHSEPGFLKEAGEQLVLRDGEQRLRHEFGPLGSTIDAYTARRALYASLYVAGIVCYAMIDALGAMDELPALVTDASRLVQEPPMKPFLKDSADQSD